MTALNITLGAKRTIEPATDALSRTSVGYDANASERDHLLAAEAAWVLKPQRAIQCTEVRVFAPLNSPDAGNIVAVGDLHGLRRDPREPRRYVLIVTPRQGDPLVGTRPEHSTSQNPVSYTD